ncbi:hypothetical protein LZ31DRAFT_599213 [Colletotrichum somersetense]|nr:hypothetical protein LZ31DRAFT_599213 [Colletotrichum somersetense]
MILQQPRLDDMCRSVSDALRSHPAQSSVNQPEANQQNAQNGTKSAIANSTASGARRSDRGPSGAFFAVSLTGVALARLRQACKHLCEAVEIFRTIFVPLGDEPVQQAVVLQHLQPDMVVRNADGSLDAAMYSFCNEVLSREFSPGHPMTTFAILHQPQAQRTRLVMSMSHAHYDGLSLSLIAETLAASYQEPPVPRLLDDDNSPQPRLHDRSQARIKVCIEIASVQARDGVTAATVIYAGWACVLSSLTGATDVVFRRLVSGRNSANAGGFHNVVGPCINYVPVRAKFGDAEERQVLADLQEQYISGLQHETLGPSKIVDQCTDWPAASVFGSTVHYQNVGEEPLFSLDEQNYVRLETVEEFWRG